MMCEVASLISRVDHLHNQYNFAACYQLIADHLDANKPPSNHELALKLEARWARAIYYYAMFVASGKEKKHTFERGLSVAKKLVESNTGEGHLWYGVLLGTTTKSHGYKKQLELCAEIGAHLKLAVELLPNVYDAQHGYGRLNYEIADLSGCVKTLLKWTHLGHKLPSCTYSDALKHFLEAEKISPNMYSMNALYIGKCYIQLGQKENAIPHLKRAVKWKVQFADDETAKKDAKILLTQLGITNCDC